jgi:hypothetical protein
MCTHDEPPELWADDPELWALVRQDTAHSSAFWTVILACGHVETMVTGLEVKSRDVVYRGRRVILRLDGSGGQCRRGGLLSGRAVNGGA